MPDGYGSRNQSSNDKSNQYAAYDQFDKRASNLSTTQSTNQFPNNSANHFNNNSTSRFNSHHQIINPELMDLSKHPQPALLRDHSNLRGSSGGRTKFKNFAGFSQIYADNLFEEFFKDD